MGTPVLMEPSLKYHPGNLEVLTLARHPGRGQCMVGSLTGAVSSQRVTEEHEGGLITVGHREISAGRNLPDKEFRYLRTVHPVLSPVTTTG